MTPAIYDVNCSSLVRANGNNVPVKMSISRTDENDEGWIRDPNKESGYIIPQWRFTANCYQPLTGDVEYGWYRVYCDDRDVLVAYVQKYIRPLYETALANVLSLGTVIDKDGTSYFGSWHPITAENDEE